MNIRMVCASTACALLMGVAPLASAGSMSLNRFRNHTLPVLVTVNSQGEITRIQPAYDMPPAVKPLLKTTLDQLITGPSIKHGKGIASQAVIQLAVEAVPQEDGRFEVRLAYVKAIPVPYGSWFWNHDDRDQLALQSDSSRMRHRYYRHGDIVQPSNPYWNSPASHAAFHSQPRPAQHMAPAPRAQPAPARGRSGY